MDHQPHDTANTTQLLSLSLFLMLLAFFIVMNALSTYNKGKVEPIVDSLQKAFASSEVGADLASSIRLDIVGGLKDGDTLQQVENLFRSEIPALNVNVIYKYGILHVQLSVEEFSKAVLALGQRAQNINARDNAVIFVPTLVRIMANSAEIANVLDDAPFRLDMVMHYGPRDDQSLYGFNFDRLTQFAVRLENSGMPPSLMSIGMVEGDPEMMDLYFYKDGLFAYDAEVRRK